MGPILRDNPMLEQIAAVPSLIERLSKEQWEDVRLVLSAPELCEVKNIIVLGCGDSYMAATSASLALSMLSQVHVQTVTAMQASRYMAPIYTPLPAKSTLVIAISCSGETARVLEACQCYRCAGAVTLAVTCNRQSRLGRAADKVLEIPRIPGRGPGINSFITILLSLYLFAIRMAEVKGIKTMPEAELLRQDLVQCARIIRDKRENQNQIIDFANTCSIYREIEFIGCGPALGIAEFGVAKVLEATGMRALARETEEFCHLNFFRTNPQQIPTVFLKPRNSLGRSRLEEVERLLEVLERPLLTLDAGEAPEIFAPLCLALQTAQLAAYLPDNCEEEYFRGHCGVWSGEGYLDVCESKIEG